MNSSTMEESKSEWSSDEEKSVMSIMSTIQEEPSKTVSDELHDPWSEENLQEVIDLWELNPHAEQLLRRLQDRVKDVQHEWNDPHVLVRYMYAPHGYAHAERLFRAMVDWRRANDVDSMLQTYQPNPLLLDYASPLAILKDSDKDGDPIYLERGGVVDGAGLLKRFSQEELMRHAIWLREVQSSGAWVEQREKEMGRSIKDITVVYDLKGLTYCSPTVLAWFQSHMKMTEDYYPGPIKRIIIIRAPAIFRVVWSVVKHFFPKCARDKMVFAGANNHMEVLGKYIDLKNLPPCINPEGQGGSAIGMPENCFEAGRIPSHVGKGGKNYTPKQPWVSPHLTVQPASPLAKKVSDTSNHTASTACDVSDDELDASNNSFERSGEWEEVIFRKDLDHDQQEQHILWEEPTGVEITHNIVDSHRSLLFI